MAHVQKAAVVNVRAIILGGLVLGLAGYLVAGQPMMPSRPAPPRAVEANIAPELDKAREQLLARMGDAALWMSFSDLLVRQGKADEAIEGLRMATRAMPDNADLWVTYGNVLLQHANGQMTPAAQLAFSRASEANPNHPAPLYFLALAWLQAGEPDEALKVMQVLEARSPPDAPWRPRLERMMRGARAMIAAGVDGGRFNPPGDDAPAASGETP